jgi:bisphosphoglycerate-independent phosphoglycerate mutase (AlkP superfamily)
MLVVMDGFGLRDNNPGNAIVAARKPNLDYLFNAGPRRLIRSLRGRRKGNPDYS